MLKKEIKEILRTYRWLLLPLVLVFFGLAQPLGVKLMPAILKNTNTPGMSVSVASVPPEQVLISVFQQYSSIGILIIILMVMGSVAGEKASGVAGSVLVKPVSRGSYLGAKFIVYALLTTISFALGMLAAGFYTKILIGGFSIPNAVLGSLVYLVYLLLAVALTLLTSTLFDSQMAAGGTALIALIAVTLLPRLAEWSKQLFPGALTEQAGKIVTTGAGEPLPALLFSSVLILLLLGTAWFSLTRQEL